MRRLRGVPSKAEHLASKLLHSLEFIGADFTGHRLAVHATLRDFIEGLLKTNGGTKA